MRILAGLFGAIALSDLWEVGSTLAGWNDEPRSIFAIHGVLFAMAVVSAIGLWRAARWTVPIVILWGLVIAAFIIALEPLLSLPADARSGLWIGALTMLVFSIAVAFYARRHTRIAAPLGASS